MSAVELASSKINIKNLRTDVFNNTETDFNIQKYLLDKNIIKNGISQDIANKILREEKLGFQNLNELAADRFFGNNDFFNHRNNIDQIEKAIKRELEYAKKGYYVNSEQDKNIQNVLILGRIIIPEKVPSKINYKANNLIKDVVNLSEVSDIHMSKFLTSAFAARLLYPNIEIQKYLNTGFSNMENELHLESRNFVYFSLENIEKLNYFIEPEDKDITTMAYVKMLYPGFLENNNYYTENDYINFKDKFINLTNTNPRQAKIFGMYLAIINSDKALFTANGINLINKSILKEKEKDIVPLPLERSFA